MHMMRLVQRVFVALFVLATLAGPVCDTSCAFENNFPVSTADGCCAPSAPEHGGHPADHDSGNHCGTKNSRNLTAVLVNAPRVHFEQIPLLQSPDGGISGANESAPLSDTSQSGPTMILPDLEKSPLPLRV
jgi:hypothetical protein